MNVCSIAAFGDFLRSPHSQASRLIMVYDREAWLAVLNIYKQENVRIVRLSDLIQEYSWLPTPFELFGKLEETIAQIKDQEVLILGLHGYLALITEQYRSKDALSALNKFLQNNREQECIILLRYESWLEEDLARLDSYSRLQQRRQLILFEPSTPPDLDFALEDNERYEEEESTLCLLDAQYQNLLPSHLYCSLAKYLREEEEHPFSNTQYIISMDLQGRILALAHDSVQQLITPLEILHHIYHLSLPFSQEAACWICEKLRNVQDQPAIEVLTTEFFPKGDLPRFILQVFDNLSPLAREVLLGILRKKAPKGSYLEYIVNKEDITSDTLRAVYVTGFVNCLEQTSFIEERKQAIHNSSEQRASANIRQSIQLCSHLSSSLVIPWLCCGTTEEKTEIIRRCSEEKALLAAAVVNYPELEAYLSSSNLFNSPDLERYFELYRQSVVLNSINEELFSLLDAIPSFEHIESRNNLLKKYARDHKTCLLLVDAMGAEWLPMLFFLANKQHIGIELAQVARANTPSTTAHNTVVWPAERRLADMKSFDNIAHVGAVAYEKTTPFACLAELLDLPEKVLSNVREALLSYEQVIVTADHGTSRLTILAHSLHYPQVTTIKEEGIHPENIRYCKSLPNHTFPDHMVATLDNEFWMVKNYNRLSLQGSGGTFAVHGGATPEEILVPFLVFSKSGSFVPKLSTKAHAQIEEIADFDL